MSWIGSRTRSRSLCIHPQVGRRNLNTFRLHNTSFDMIGGVLYFVLVVSVCITIALAMHDLYPHSMTLTPIA